MIQEILVLLGRFAKMLRRNRARVTLGFACGLKNPSLSVELFGSPREIRERFGSDSSISLADVLDHCDTAVSFADVHQDEPLLEFHGGPHAERLLRFLGYLPAPPNEKALAELADVLDPGVEGSFVPLLSAAAENQLDLVVLLIRLGAAVDLPGHFGMSPLHWAAARGHEEVVRTLLDAKAEASEFNWFYLSPGELAALNGYRRIAKMLGQERFRRNIRWTQLTWERMHSL